MEQHRICRLRCGRARRRVRASVPADPQRSVTDLDPIHGIEHRRADQADVSPGRERTGPSRHHDIVHHADPFEDGIGGNCGRRGCERSQQHNGSNTRHHGPSSLRTERTGPARQPAACRSARRSMTATSVGETKASILDPCRSRCQQPFEGDAHPIRSGLAGLAELGRSGHRRPEESVGFFTEPRQHLRERLDVVGGGMEVDDAGAQEESAAHHRIRQEGFAALLER